MNSKGFMMAEVVVVSAIVMVVLTALYVSYNKLYSSYNSRVNYYDSETLYQLAYYRDSIILNDKLDVAVNDAKNNDVSVVYNLGTGASYLGSVDERKNERVVLIYNDKENLTPTILNNKLNNINPTFKEYMDYLSSAVDLTETNYVMVMESCKSNGEDCKYAYLEVSENSRIGSLAEYTVVNVINKLGEAFGTYNSYNYEAVSTETYTAHVGTVLNPVNMYKVPSGASIETFKGYSTSFGTSNVTLNNGTVTLGSAPTTYYMWFDRACSEDNLAACSEVYGCDLTGFYLRRGPNYDYSSMLNYNISVGPGAEFNYDINNYQYYLLPGVYVGEGENDYYSNGDPIVYYKIYSNEKYIVNACVTHPSWCAPETAYSSHIWYINRCCITKVLGADCSDGDHIPDADEWYNTDACPQGCIN